MALMNKPDRTGLIHIQTHRSPLRKVTRLRSGVSIGRAYNRVIALLIGVFLLAACGGGDSDGSLPTLFPTLESEGPPLAAEVTPPLAEATAPAEITPDGPPSPESPPAPGSDGAPVGVSLTEDFSALTPGETVALVGLVDILTENGTLVAVLRDAQGSELQLLQVPLGMVEPMAGQPVQVIGLIVSADETPTGRLGIVPSSLSAAAGENAPPDASGPLPETSAEPGAAGGQPPFAGPPVVQGEPLDIQLEANLTALQAYDALLPLIEGDLEGYFWSSASGTPEIGWTFEFFNAEDNSATAYLVAPDGTVRLTTATPFFAVPGGQIYPIDRARVVVDSDVVVQAVRIPDAPPIGSPLITLRALDETRIEWTALGVTPVVIDATTSAQP